MTDDIPGQNNVLRERCFALWAILDEQSNHIDGVGNEGNEGKGAKFWTGKISQVYETIGIPLGSSAKVINQLCDLGCLGFVQRGNSVQPTVLRIGVDPAEVEWIAPERNNRPSDLTARQSYATLVQTVEDIRKRLGGIDLTKAFSSLQAQIAEQDDRIVNLTKRLDALNGEKQANQG